MNTPSSLSVVIAGGGTTGHISPMLAVRDMKEAIREGWERGRR